MDLPKYPLSTPPEPPGRDVDRRLPAFRLAVLALVVGGCVAVLGFAVAWRVAGGLVALLLLG
jgi:hypothetical protein